MTEKRRGRPPKTDKKETQATESFHENSVETDKPKDKKKGTKPGWKPAGQLPKLKAPPGFSPKWASSDPGKLTRLRHEGWILMKPEDHKGVPIINVDINDVGAVSGELRYRDLVAVMLPNDLKEARDEWLREENKGAMKNILNTTDQELDQKGVQTYAPEGQAGRIVID